MHALWFEGNDHGLVWSHGMALVSGEVSVRAAGDLWLEFGDGGDLATFLKLLSVHTGTDVLSLPGFAIALRTARGDWQLAARGAWVAQVDDELVGGAGISTWAERSVCGGSAAYVGRVRDPADGRPLVAGLVVAGGMAWGDVVPAVALNVAENTPSTIASVPAPAPFERATLEVSASPTCEPAPIMPSALLDSGEAAALACPTSPADEPLDDLYTLDPAEEPPAIDEVPHPIEDRVAEEQPEEDAAPDDPAPDPEMVQVPRAEGAEPGEPAPSGRFARQYGDTELFTIEDAAVRTDLAGEFITGTPRPESHDDEGDHDGHTVLAADFAGGVTAPEEQPEPEPEGEWLVLGVRCERGHPNPPHRNACFTCGSPTSGPAQRMPRPLLGRLKLPSGEVIDLTTPVIVGRNPRVERCQGTVLPRLVPLSQGHVSSNHLELRLEEWNVLAVDLHSTNGTFLRRRGEAPVRLGERPEILMDGDVLDLGHGVQLTLEGLR